VSGAVKLQVVVDADGKVLRTTVISGHSLLVGAAIEAIRQYKFAPGNQCDSQLPIAGLKLRDVPALSHNR
jgi:outer membrane biosynthesis protein TonB